jgi:hypothetical protein
MVKKEMQAVYDSLLNPTSSTSVSGSGSSSVGVNPQLTTYNPLPTGNYFGGWLLWNPSNVYTEGALSSK